MKFRERFIINKRKKIKRSYVSQRSYVYRCVFSRKDKSKRVLLKPFLAHPPFFFQVLRGDVIASHITDLIVIFLEASRCIISMFFKYSLFSETFPYEKEKKKENPFPTLFPIPNQSQLLFPRDL